VRVIHAFWHCILFVFHWLLVVWHSILFALYWVWRIVWFAFGYLPEISNALLGVVGVILSFPHLVDDIEKDPKKRRMIMSVCLVLGFGGFAFGVVQKFQADQQMRGLVHDQQNALNLITGDDSYLHFDIGQIMGPSPAQGGTARVWITAQAYPLLEGSFPLHDAQVGAFCNVVGWVTAPGGIWYGTYYPNDFGRPHWSVPLQFPAPEKDSQCSLGINASNGAFLQRVRFRYRNGKWTWASRLSRYDGAKFGGSNRHDYQDPDFPKDQLEGDW